MDGNVYRSQTSRLSRTVDLLVFLLVAAYVTLFFVQMPTPLFSYGFAGNDGRQQLFPFYTAIFPGIFENDLIYRSMSGYLGPIHWVLGSLITKFTMSPIMTGHCVMAIQLSLVVVFLFLAVRKAASTPAAFVAIAWLFHTQWLIRGTFGGLPRGWAGFVLTAFLYFFLSKNHKAILCVIVLGCMLHPPATFVVSVCYSIYLGIEFLRSSSRSEVKTPLITFLAACPFIYLVAHFAVQRPADIGEMVTLEQARKMPAFSTNHGRFPFVPLPKVMPEIKKKGLKVFLKYKSGENGVYRKDVGVGVLAFLGGTFLFWLLTKRPILPKQILIFGLAVCLSFFLARIFAFRLYVPSRYLGWPVSAFFLVAVPTMLWRMGYVQRLKVQWISLTFLAALSVCIYLIGGSGLGGRTNFKEGRDFFDPLYVWIRANTPKEALIAGHPSNLDGIQLYGIRKGYVTTETAHPFYDKYNEEMERRLRLAFMALYSRNSEEFLKITDAEKIDYFVFSAKYFRQRRGGKGDTFKKAQYFRPHDKLVKKLVSRPADQYFFTRILRKGTTDQFPFIVHRTKTEVIVSTAKLREFSAGKVL